MLSTLFKVSDQLVEPIKNAVRENSIIYVAQTPAGVLATPSIVSRAVAFCVGNVLLTMLSPIFLLGPLLFLVGMTNSKAHLGHWLFGYQVVSSSANQPVGFIGIVLRWLLSGVPMLFLFMTFASATILALEKEFLANLPTEFKLFATPLAILLAFVMSTPFVIFLEGMFFLFTGKRSIVSLIGQRVVFEKTQIM